MAHISTDSPLSRRIVRSFLHFLNSVEAGAGVDAEGIEVARECLAEAFKLNSFPETGHRDSLIDIFQSLEANKQCETPQPDSLGASSSSQNPANAENHGEASKSQDEDWIQGSHTFAASKNELRQQFFSSLDKNHYLVHLQQMEKASNLFNDAFMEMERSGYQEMSLKNLAESLKSLGNKAMQSKQYPDAVELYNYAIALYEKSAVYYCNRAAAYTQINKYTEAIRDCLRSIEIDPNYSKAYSRLGLAYYAQGNYRDAIMKGFKKVLDLDPNNESAKENIEVAVQKIIEQRYADQNQDSRSYQEFQNQFPGGSTSNAVPPSFTSVPFNPSDLASMFMNIPGNSANAFQGSHPQERQDSNAHGANETEIRFGDDVSVNFGQMPEDISGAIHSVIETFFGAAPSEQEDQMNGRPAPN